MQQNKSYIILAGLFIWLLLCTSVSSNGQDTLGNLQLPSDGNIYVSANAGNNSNNGDSANPLLTLEEAAKKGK